ncbi:Ebp2-domain-containing protein [Gloeophyllum trabeum ATCC 11539]|uniref:Ebp2-domain-containing protein n=1 Tax=Gloeophyllum trabeum (strain ATCC 11539 / FP-39264 / Madison 617) TaxID=670483 RepID=S7Q5A4_GLOTA|nr:Ebp2-domain-containing protein [Gloeophyllum trabeum ATCC 11539]EPQ54682.1 Ebp2-domain-containing protein [Gloeophyllum trabeum ATCC 11539]
MASSKKASKVKAAGSAHPETHKVAKKKAAVSAPATPPSEEPEDASEDYTDEEDVDEEGMARLMKALGDDGLGEYDLAQLQLLNAEDDGEDEDVGSGSEDASEGEEDGVSESEGEGNEGEGEGSNRRNAEPQHPVAEDEEDEEAVPLDEVESVDEDAVPRQKIEIDNKIALERIRDTIKLDPSLPWTETLSISYPDKIEVDVDDDLNRELAFYKQALHAANTARALASQHNLPFTRPSDYFAEMVKSDAHMERIRQRLLNESASIKKSEEKRREREGKKFGKQVQLEKQKERERSKKEMEERLKGLKRKRKDALDPQGDGEDFDVAVEDAISDRPSKRPKGESGSGHKLNRNARDKKFGFGGKGKRSKQNTKSSTDDFGGGGGRGKGPAGKAGKGGKGVSKGAKRPGKSRRMAARSKH